MIRNFIGGGGGRGDFMRVRVAVNITKSLCRGRKATFSQNSNGWILFKYKQLPSCCFWCGGLDHRDKECDIWLKIKGYYHLKISNLVHGCVLLNLIRIGDSCGGQRF